MGILGFANALGTAADMGQKYIDKQEKLKQDQLLIEQEKRAEQARTTRAMAMEKWKMDMQSQQEISKEERAEKREINKENRQAARDAKKPKEEKDPSAFKEKLAAVEADDSLTPEEKQKIKKAIYGLKDDSLTEAQKMKLMDQLAEFEESGIYDTNINAINRLREQLGLKKLNKKITKPARKGFFVDDPEEYEYTEDQVEEQEKKQVTTLDKYKQMLANGGQIGLTSAGEKSSMSTTGLLNQQAGIPPEEIAKLKGMTVQQLQVVLDGLMKSAGKDTPQSQEIIKQIHELIRKQQSGLLSSR